MFLARATIAALTDDCDAGMRLLASNYLEGPWHDIRKVERLRLERAGAPSRGARRMASALIPSGLTEALEYGDIFLDAASRAAWDSSGDAIVEDIELAAPVNPPIYRDFMVFERHFSFGYKLRELPVPDVLYEFPVSYLGSPANMIGPGDDVPWPHYSSFLDYELEIGVVLAKDVHNVTPDAAREAILGLCILNDFSARDIQIREMQGGLGPCKGKHFATSVGPVIATLDELDPANLRLNSRINGESWCEATSAEMIWSIEEIVAWASASEKIPCGSLLGTGTANGGSAIEIGKQLHPGDLVEIEIEGLGILRNRLGEPGQGWMPAARARAA